MPNKDTRMRQLSTNSDLSDIPEPLREEVAACLQRWRTSGVLAEPETELIALVEPGDSITTVAALLGDDVADDEFVLPAEWVTDLGCMMEAYVCWSDDGHGISLLVPKADSTDPALLALCLDLVSPPT
jgi:hypothetical protein